MKLASTLSLFICANAQNVSQGLEIPVYNDCFTEFASFNAVYRYDAKLHGDRDSSVDRFSIFCINLKNIQMHNRRALAGNSTYSQGINEFSDWTPEERSRYIVNGYSPMTEEENAALGLPLYEAPQEYTITEGETGKSSDFRSKMPGIKNQGGCGSCWTFGAVDVVDFFGGSHSEQQILDCDTRGHGCNGGDPRQALSYLASAGSETESQYPYDGRQRSCRTKRGSTQVSSVKAVGSNEQALASAAAKQVVSIAISFQRGNDNGFMNYKNGIFDGVCQDRNGGGHAIATVGIQKSYYIVRNSWGQSWGQKGYAYIKRGDNICNLAQHSTVATARPHSRSSFSEGFAPPATCKSMPKACSGTCKIEEAAPKKGGDLHIDVQGSCAGEAISSATYDMTIVFGGLPVLTKKGNDATKDGHYNLPLNMGSIVIPAVKFPVAAGEKLLLPGVAHIGKLAPSGKLTATFDAHDQDKKALFSFEVDITL